MKMPGRENRYFVVCATTREDLLPTAYYDHCGELVSDEKGAAKFSELDMVLKFVEDHRINLGESNLIGVSFTG
ncbi:MAG: hypothetical protein ACP5SH_16390 [Syntrophobacteraceae bacterium]